MGVIRSERRPCTRDIVLAFIEANPGQRPKDIRHALQRQHPALTYDMVVKALRTLHAVGDVVVEHAAGGVARYYVPPEPPLAPFVNPIRARYLRLVGAMP